MAGFHAPLRGRFYAPRDKEDAQTLVSQIKLEADAEPGVVGSVARFQAALGKGAETTACRDPFLASVASSQQKSSQSGHLARAIYA